MDLSRYNVASAASAGADLHLRDPFTGELLWDGETAVTIRIRGKDAPEVKAAAREADKAVVKGEADDTERMVRVLCAATVGWQGLSLDGDEAFTHENVRRLYTDPATEWVVEQVAPFFLSRANYARNMPTD